MTETRTRYGRTIKKPDRYEPQEICEDDYTDSEDECEEIVIKKQIKKKPRTINLDEDSDGETLGSDSEDDSEDEDDSDADEEGNLKGFVCYSDEDSDEDE